ncbi:ribonuclease P protein subunit [Candidatus Woesearchaeota archaeon]|jgi:ribonuclease P protein subunit POP4|nr:ribonuclease P protein subunit [Candidatus Woesearchaeota archaeon]MBT5342052.1 ribonuclease P protein subunit [Candidatus Woesearchaeota archaeon]
MVKKKIFPYELIGEKIEILHSKNKSNLGIKGKVIDETKMTLKIKWGEKVKTLLKNNITFKIVRNEQIITGQEIMKRPEERIKGK